MQSKEIIKDMLDVCNKYNLESVPIMKSEQEQVLKDLEEKERQSLLLKNIGRNNCKSVTPLCDIFQGLKQEERYKYIEHIYYSYKELEEQKELLETELKLEKDKVKYVMKQLEKQDKILEILKPYFSGAIFPSAINFNFNEKDWKPIKEWLESGKN